MTSQNKKKKKKNMPNRLNLLFFAVFLLFSGLVLRLGFVQIVHGENYRKEVDRTENITVNAPVPRGKIYDRNGNVVVDNKPLNAITYTRTQSTPRREMIEVAEKLAQMIEFEDKFEEKIQFRDKQDFWIIRNPEEARALITDEDREKVNEGELEEKDLYPLQLSRITEEMVSEFTLEDLKILSIFRQMNSGYALTPQTIKNENVSDREYAIISERLSDLPGVDTTVDWDRDRLFDNTLGSLLGKVGDIPSERATELLARGYSRNDRVGTSQLEYQYENVLQGQKARVRNVTDQSGNLLMQEPVFPGQRGKDLVLSIDMEFQLEVEKIIESELLEAKQNSYAEFLDRAFVVVLDPNTGEVLSLAGKVVNKDENGQWKLVDNALGTILEAYEAGSTIKGATILAGFDTGVISPGTVLYDTPISIASTPTKRSWQTMGNINDLEALERSSNVYMFRTAMFMAGGNYVRNQPLPIRATAFEDFRSYLAQFGLGVHTGIDLPSESTGLKGPGKASGLILDLAIGQYDLYTTMQLAQYVSTIANGGYRLRPQIVREILEPSGGEKSGQVLQPFKPEVLNRLTMSDDHISRVQEGFRRVYFGSRGTAAGSSAKQYKPAGKTGTAQKNFSIYTRDEEGKIISERKINSNHTNLVGYAPYDNPEMAFAVVVPFASTNTQVSGGVNSKIGDRIIEAYFTLQERRAKGQPNIQEQEELEEQEDMEETEEEND
ncbi:MULTISPECIES: peptidoglycan D,D-transpeptidase FtsI family protein [Bacillus]|uniref:peptidoglycan D,D-transpeptidase FtsI family protein n=1 Tax=Bacillus TaxID=1386 RepID=UPI000BB8541B|nr:MULTISPECIES: penicillin-binding protein 2 [Bacillus]